MEEWHPHPKQEEALEQTAFEVLYGGARGGGKTDAGLVWLTEYLDHPRFRALVIRKNADDLADWIDRAQRMYHILGVDIAYRPAIIRFPSGAVVRTGHLKDEQSYTKYMGQEFPRILIEELTQIPTEKRYLQLIASCRSTVPELKPQIFATTNPGGLGHVWVKKRFVDPAPSGTEFEVEGRTRIFVPSTIDDNPTLMINDPDYVKGLDALKSTDEQLWKAWRLGDWNTFAGQFFREFRTELHVIPPFIPNKNNIIVGGMDWGRTAPFSFHLTEISIIEDEGVKFHRARTFLEVYGTDKTPHEWAVIIKEKIKGADLRLSDITWIQGDPAMFTKGNDNSLSIADQFKRDDILLRPGSNDRVGGWTNLHQWLSLAVDTKPYWQIGENCHNLIRTLPELIHDENKVEDVNTQSEDHCLIAGTRIRTNKDERFIEHMRVGDLVLTRNGYKKVVVSLMTKKQARVYEVTFSNGTTLIGTANHPVYVKNSGFISIDALRYNDGVCTRLSYLQQFKSLMDNGMRPKKVKNGIVSMVKNRGKIGNNITKYVSSAVENIKRLYQWLQNTVTLTVKWPTLDSGVRVVKVKYHSTQPVYNLTIQDQHEYFANGILTHNSADEQRYQFKALKWIDSKAGAVTHQKPKAKLAPVMIDGKQVSINLDKFEDPQGVTRTGRVGGVVLK